LDVIPKYEFWTKIWIFEETFYFWRKFAYLAKKLFFTTIEILQKEKKSGESYSLSIFFLLTKNLIFEQNLGFSQTFRFLTKFRFSTKISIFNQNFDFRAKFRCLTKILIFINFDLYQNVKFTTFMLIFPIYVKLCLQEFVVEPIRGSDVAPHWPSVFVAVLHRS